MELRMTMTTADGVELTASTDLELAQKWAAHVWGERWATVGLGRQAVEVAAAQREIALAHQGAGLLREPALHPGRAA